MEWYRSAASLFEEDEAPASGRASQTGDQAYPNLGTVPARPTDISSPSERRALQQGLVADRDQARYTDQQPANAIGGGTPPVPVPDTARTAPAAAPAQAATPTPPPAPATPAPPPAPAATAPAATTPSAPPSPAVQPPAARIAPRAETTEPQSAGAAMLERRRQEVLAERAAAAATADAGKLPQAPAATPQPSAPQASAPAARTEPRPEVPAESRPRTASEIYREEFARSAAPVATRSAEPAPAQAAAPTQAPTQAAAAPDRAAPAAADRSGISYLAATILFDHGSTALDPAERETLRRIAAEHRKAGGSLRIVGHASSRTTDMRPLQHQLANFQVSVSRAETVAQELARLGVPVRAMEVIGVGDSQPIYYEVMPAGEAGNRRVEIFVDY